MHLRHDTTVAADFHSVNVGVWWQSLFEGYLNSYLFACATKLQGITTSRATKLQYGAPPDSTLCLWIIEGRCISEDHCG